MIVCREERAPFFMFAEPVMDVDWSWQVIEKQIGLSQ